MPRRVAGAKWSSSGSTTASRNEGRRGNEQATQQGRNMSNTFTPGPAPNSVRSADGKVLTAPDGWILIPPGDAALTRRVKAAGDHWVVAEKKGRKVFSRGVWAAAATIEQIRADLESERSTDEFARKKQASVRRRGTAQAE